MRAREVMLPVVLPVPRSRLLIGALGALGALGSLVAVTSVPERDVAGATNEGEIAPVGVLVPDASLDPRIIAMDLVGTVWTEAVNRLDTALFAQAENDRELQTTLVLIDELGGERSLLDQRHRSGQGDAARLEAEIALVESILRSRAVEQYVNFGLDPLAGIDDPAVVTDLQRAAELTRRVDEVQFGARTELLAQQASIAEDLAALEGRLLETEVALLSAEARRDLAMMSVLALDDAVSSAIDRVRRARRNAAIPGSDLSVVALDAYLSAERLLAESWPSCQISWNMIAGVARIESRHGRFGGRRLGADGRPDTPIIGIALDGGPGVRAIHDTDDGAYDGDDVWDRAVGPLQFIPTTWVLRGRDGSGDGVADPQNLYDAAYSSGRYLCALGGDLRARSNLRAAYFGYNRSTEYVDDVIAHTDRYGRLDLPVVVDSVENPE